MCAQKVETILETAFEISCNTTDGTGRQGRRFVAVADAGGGPAFSQNCSVDKIADHQKTETPIKHVIVIIGENRTFDHVFATYVPRSQDSVSNLLSKQIIKADGSPGKNFAKAAQFEAVKPFKTEYFVSLSADEKKPYDILPQPTLNFSPTKPIFPAGTLIEFSGDR